MEYVLIFISTIGIILGLLLCMTGFGAICGLPMFLISIVINIIGCIMLMQKSRERMAESVKIGILQGLNKGDEVLKCACGALLPKESTFCSKCGGEIRIKTDGPEETSD
ncbi:MAG: hypothetical protein ABRQ39_30560 [Candidatus Eremiobacterota bacterium]